MGVTHLDVMRAKTFVSEVKGFTDPTAVDVPVIGGHAGATILPLLSQTTPKCTFTTDEIEKLTERIQNGGTEVVDAKGGAGSATLSMAAAAAEFADACLRGLSGESGIWVCAYVESNVTKLPFFATKVLLGKNGVERVSGTGSMTPFEKQAMENMLPELEASIKKGINFVHSL
jgi:malate dehydrogenase